MTTNEQIFIKNLKYFRSKKQLSQGQMAVKIGVDVKRYHKWEKAKAFPNDVTLLLRITEICEATLHDMLTVEIAV